MVVFMHTCASGSRLLSVALAALVMSSAIAGAEVYKWVDDDGKTHYGDRPPARADTEKFDVRPGNAAHPVPDDLERRARRDRLLEAFEHQRADRASEREAARQDLAKKKQLRRDCAFALEDLDRVRGARYIYDFDEQGERRILSDAERERYVSNYQKGYDKHCK